MKLLLDTHILIWWMNGSDQLPAKLRRILRRARHTPPVFVSDISLWETAVLVELGRIELDMPLQEWLERASAAPLVERVGITPAVAAETTRLPADFHRDPADRILAATARALGLRLMTVDQRLIRSAAVPVV
ncbi:MAG: type II toxin-antitoxin system VapC family toxin [Phycisphaerales bacterium]|nr:MAG: type II toxin-antitoxin system VapC family toxin [Phycisphaerales bacterium]